MSNIATCYSPVAAVLMAFHTVTCVQTGRAWANTHKKSSVDTTQRRQVIDIPKNIL